MHDLQITALTSGASNIRTIKGWLADVCPYLKSQVFDVEALPEKVLAKTDIAVLDSGLVQTLENSQPWIKYWHQSDAFKLLIVDTKDISELIQVSERWKASGLVRQSDDEQAQKLFEQLVDARNRRVQDLIRLDQLKRLNQQAERMTSSLEKTVAEQTEQDERSRDQMAVRVNEIRSLIRSLTDLAEVRDFQGLMELLRRESRKIHRVENPVLGFVSRTDQITLFYYQGLQFTRMHPKELWSYSVRLRLNVPADSLYLANQLGRPFGRVIAIPLLGSELLNETRQIRNAVLFFEHDLSQDEETQFVDFISPRLQPFAVALDRLLLETELKQISLMWENTFDGLNSPIAIVDLDGKILRANESFTEGQWLNRQWSESTQILTAVVQAIQTREPKRLRINKNSSTYDLQVFPIHLADREEATTAVVHAIDVTRTHLLQSQMIQNEKMAAIGHLAGNIAHELNNPLTGIRSLAQIILSESQAQGRVRDDLGEVELAAERCQKTIRNLLEFAHGGVENKVVTVDLNGIVDNTLPLLKTALGDFERPYELSSSELLVAVEPHLMGQVVFNIVNNACQATPAGGKISISTTVEKNADQSWAVLKVADTGCGIPPANKVKIFDPFFTTKPPRQGTGLGLSMSRQIIESFGGTIEFKSEVNVGSEFYVYLPLVSRP